MSNKNTRFIVNGNILSLSGSSSQVDLNTLELNYWTQTNDNKLYYNIGNVGIGLNNPVSNLHLHNSIPNTNLTQATSIGHGNNEYNDNPVSPVITTTFQLTNDNTGNTKTDSLLLKMERVNATLRLQETGELKK